MAHEAHSATFGRKLDWEMLASSRNGSQKERVGRVVSSRMPRIAANSHLHRRFMRINQLGPSAAQKPIVRRRSIAPSVSLFTPGKLSLPSPQSTPPGSSPMSPSRACAISPKRKAEALSSDTPPKKAKLQPSTKPCKPLRKAYVKPSLKITHRGHEYDLTFVINGTYKNIYTVKPVEEKIPCMVPGRDNSALIVKRYQKPQNFESYIAHERAQFDVIKDHIPVAKIYPEENVEENYYLAEYIPHEVNEEQIKAYCRKGGSFEELPEDMQRIFLQIRKAFLTGVRLEQAIDIAPRNFRMRDNGELVLCDLKEEKDDVNSFIFSCLKKDICVGNKKIYNWFIAPLNNVADQKNYDFFADPIHDLAVDEAIAVSIKV